MSDRPARAWQRMLSGRRLDLLDPSPRDIEISDIAHGLARVARWNGQTIGDHAFSVAEHSLLVETIAGELSPDWPQRWRLAALLHDAPEYVVGDLISPFKAAIGIDYKAFELRLLEAVHVRFGLPPRLPDEVSATIKTADRIAAYHEARGLAGFSAEETEAYFGPIACMSPELEVMLASLAPAAAHEAHERFMVRFEALIGHAKSN